MRPTEALASVEIFCFLFLYLFVCFLGMYLVDLVASSPNNALNAFEQVLNSTTRLYCNFRVCMI